MSDLEDGLRSALRRKDPPAGFAGRVAGKVGSGTTAPRMGSRGLWWSGAIAAGIAIALAGSTIYEHRREERAGRQAMVALQIASEKLNLVRDRALRLDAGASGDTQTGKEHE